MLVEKQERFGKNLPVLWLEAWLVRRGALGPLKEFMPMPERVPGSGFQKVWLTLGPPKEFMPMPGRVPGSGFQKAWLTEMSLGNSRRNSIHPIGQCPTEHRRLVHQVYQELGPYARLLTFLGFSFLICKIRVFANCSTVPSRF